MPPVSPLLRTYTADECGADGYPLAWHRCPMCEGRKVVIGAGEHGPVERTCSTCEGAGSAKGLIRQQAGHRCLRCGHYYVPGCGTFEVVEDRPAMELFENVDQAELLAEAFTQFPDDVENLTTEKRIPPKVLWSPCDVHCSHSGLPTAQVRCRLPEEPEWGAAQAACTAAELVHAGLEVEAAWRILTVHHLDEYKANLRWWNLTSLCQRCHLNVQRRVKLERPWPFEHSEWFQLNAAGWYAHRYLRENLTPEETAARLPELLELEHTQHRLEGIG